jgi:hypothetical protein
MPRGRNNAPRFFSNKINPASSESGVLIISSWQYPTRVGGLNY